MVSGAEFLLSMVETHWYSRNGDARKMEVRLKAEQELARIEEQIEHLQTVPGQNEETRRQIEQLHGRVEGLRRQIHASYGAWEKTELARHPQRPYTLDYVERIFTDWSEIHGDRGFADDPAIVTGIARFHGEEVVVIGQQKARDAKQRVYRNFGMPHPEGYRKALRLMRLGEKFGMPVISLIDTPGAFPGIGSEERHISEAIAVNLREMMKLRVPVIAAVIGEGGSGGALGIGVADHVLIFENAYYSVISPEACSAILWRDRRHAAEAAEALKLTAQNLLKLEVVDEIIAEPQGGAHRDYDFAAANLGEALRRSLERISQIPVAELLEKRYQKFRRLGVFSEGKTVTAPARI